MIVLNGKSGELDREEMRVTLHRHLAFYLKAISASIYCIIVVCKSLTFWSSEIEKKKKIF